MNQQIIEGSILNNNIILKVTFFIAELEISNIDFHVSTILNVFSTMSRLTEAVLVIENPDNWNSIEFNNVTILKLIIFATKRNEKDHLSSHIQCIRNSKFKSNTGKEHLTSELRNIH